jgi:deoxycytidine triphosphate deaminase
VWSRRRAKVQLSGHERTLQEQDVVEAEQLPLDHLWAEKIPAAQLERELTSAFWEDPEPGLAGVLTADRIRTYHYAVGRMIRPFQEQHLNSASYDLTLGPRCLLDGEVVDLGLKRRVLRVPPGSIAMVTSREVLLMPQWLVATFNLKSKYIFEGLLMGAGPQIDPGFMGVLACPLHNISNQEVMLELCQPFAKLDFLKTTWGACVDLSGISSENQLYREEAQGALSSKNGGQPAKLWPRSKNFRPPVSHFVDSEGARSSLHRLEGEFEKVRTRVRWGTLGVIATSIGLLSLFAALVASSLIYIDGRVDDVRNDNAAAVRMELKRALRVQGSPEPSATQSPVTSP